MKYKVGDVVIVHFDGSRSDVPSEYHDLYEWKIGTVLRTGNGPGGVHYILNICKDGDYFFDEELSLVGGIDPIEFDNVLELIN